MEQKKCKICGKIISGKRRSFCENETHKDTKKYWAAEWLKKNRKINSDTLKKYYFKNKNKMLKKQYKYHMKKTKEDKEFALKNSIRAETLIKYKHLKKKCLFCGEIEKLEFHHFKYVRPLLKKHFIVVCKKCHGKLHNYVQ